MFGAFEVSQNINIVQSLVCLWLALECDILEFMMLGRMLVTSIILECRGKNCWAIGFDIIISCVENICCSNSNVAMPYYAFHFIRLSYNLHIFYSFHMFIYFSIFSEYNFRLNLFLMIFCRFIISLIIFSYNIISYISLFKQKIEKNMKRNQSNEIFYYLWFEIQKN